MSDSICTMTGIPFACFLMSLRMSCCMLDFFFFKQKTAYEMRISDWSSDGCSSDLSRLMAFELIEGPEGAAKLNQAMLLPPGRQLVDILEIGRASCRERVCQYV